MRAKREKRDRQAGFSLIELLIVVAIMGVVMLAIMNLFQNTQRSAYTQEDVVEVQQNLRNAIDLMVRDIQMSGFMNTSTAPPITSAPPFLCRDLDSDGSCLDAGEFFSLVLPTASPYGRTARIDQDLVIPDPVAPTDNINITVALPEMSDLFDIGQDVRVIRPASHGDIFGHSLEIAGANRTIPRLTLTAFPAGDAGGQIKTGDLIVRVVPAGTFPGSISYSLNQADATLIRNNGSGNEIVAEGITAADFSYLLTDGTRPTAPTASQLADIQAVEVTLTGQANTINGDKTREITSVIALRNR